MLFTSIAENVRAAQERIAPPTRGMCESEKTPAGNALRFESKREVCGPAWPNRCDEFGLRVVSLRNQFWREGHAAIAWRRIGGDDGLSGRICRKDFHGVLARHRPFDSRYLKLPITDHSAGWAALPKRMKLDGSSGKRTPSQADGARN
jgi:hypothetical protein